jgi:hypothetical protein
VKKGSKDSQIIITQDGDDILCTNVAAVSNGFTFNIPEYEGDEMLAKSAVSIWETFWTQSTQDFQAKLKM